MKKIGKIGKMLSLVAVIAMGAVVARGSDSREIKASATERAAFAALIRQGAELEDGRRKLQADTAAVMSEIRAHHRIAEWEQVVAFDPERGVFTVAPIATAAK